MTDAEPPPQKNPPPVQWVLNSSWLWLTLAIAAAIILGMEGIHLLSVLGRPLALFIIGITIASALAPSISRLEKQMPRGLGIAIVYFLLFLIIVAVMFAVIPLLVAQAKDLGSRLPNLLQQGQNWLTSKFPISISSLTSSLGAFGSAIVSLPLAIVNSFLDLLLIFFVSLYWLILSPQLRMQILSLFPATHHSRVLFILQQMGQGMGGYLRASAINGVIIGVLTYIGLVIIGVNFPAVLSLVMGILEIIPALGPTIGGAIIVLVAFLQEPRLALISLVFVIALQQLEGHILVPNIMRTQTEISPLLVILALVSGAAIGGLLGALVAIPLAAALRVLVNEFISPAIRRRTGAAND